MYTSPYKLYYNGDTSSYDYTIYENIVDAAQAWADETNAVIEDARYCIVDEDSIKSVLGW